MLREDLKDEGKDALSYEIDYVGDDVNAVVGTHTVFKPAATITNRHKITPSPLLLSMPPLLPLPPLPP